VEEEFSEVRWDEKRGPWRELRPSDTLVLVIAHDKGKPAVRRGRKAYGLLLERGGRATDKSQGTMQPSEYEEGHAHTAKAMLGIYFASKDYIEAPMWKRTEPSGMPRQRRSTTNRSSL
jgi:hypothetical protein